MNPESVMRMDRTSNQTRYQKWKIDSNVSKSLQGPYQKNQTHTMIDAYNLSD